MASFHFPNSGINLFDNIDVAVKTSNSLLYYNLQLHLVLKEVPGEHGNLEDWIFCPPCCFENYKNHQ